MFVNKYVKCGNTTIDIKLFKNVKKNYHSHSDTFFLRSQVA